MSAFNVWPTYSMACREAMDELLKAGGSLSAYRANKAYGTGPKDGSWAWRCEREIERQFHVGHAVLTNSGTAALHAALEAVGVRGGFVVTSPYTFSATAASILLAGAKPVFADVDRDTYSITEETVKDALRGRKGTLKAIVPVSLFGRVADTARLATRFGVPVVEDACQAVGARKVLDAGAPGPFAGTVSAAGAYSFNGGKNCPGGEGGCLVTNDGKVAELARLLGNHGENFGTCAPTFGSGVGLNYRPTELQAVVIYDGLRELRTRNLARIRLAQTLSVLVEDLPLEVPHEFDGSHVYYVYPFRLRPEAKISRKRFIEKMALQGVEVGGGYITPTLEEYPAFRKYQDRDLPAARELSKRSLCLLSQVNPSNDLLHMKIISEAMHECLPRMSRSSSRVA